MHNKLLFLLVLFILLAQLLTVLIQFLYNQFHCLVLVLEGLPQCQNVLVDSLCEFVIRFDEDVNCFLYFLELLVDFFGEDLLHFPLVSPECVGHVFHLEDVNPFVNFEVLKLKIHHLLVVGLLLLHFELEVLHISTQLLPYFLLFQKGRVEKFW